MAKRLIYDPAKPEAYPNYGQQSTGINQDQVQEIKTNIGSQILQQGGKLSDIKTALDLITPIQMSADAEKRKFSKEDGERIITLLEQAYFGGPNGPLSYGVKGELGRLTGLSEELLAKYQADYNPYLNNYLAQLETVKPTFAKLYGDVGNLSASEQKQAIKSLPTGKDSISEAILKLSWTRQKLGLKPKNYADILPQQGVTQTTRGNGQVIDLDYSPLQGIGKTKFKSPLGETEEIKIGTGKSLKELSVLQRLLGTEAQSQQVNLPLAGAGGEIGSMVGSMTHLPPGLRVLLGGSIGQTYENIGRQGLPLTVQEGNKRLQEMGVGNDIRNPLTYLNPVNQAKMGTSLVKPVLPYALADLLFNLKDVTGALKPTIGKNLSPIKPQEVVKPQTDYITKVLGEGKQALKAIKEVKGKYVNPLDIPSAITRKEFLGKVFRKSSGGQKSTTSALLGDYERKILKDAIHDRSSLIAALDKVDELLIKTGRIGKFLGKVATTGAVGAGAAYGIGKAFGYND